MHYSDELDTIIKIAIIQSLYDLAGWKGLIQTWLRADEHGTAAKIYRYIKETLDFPVTIFILFQLFGISWWWFIPYNIIIISFLVFKWLHGCDSFYNIWEHIIDNKATTEWGEWRFWTPLGLMRCSFWGLCMLPGFTKYEYDWKMGHWTPEGQRVADLDYKAIPFQKGMVSIKEAWIQTGIGLILSALILLIWG